jgi:hypothetical protein
MMHFEPDIIETIESLATDFIKRNKRLPSAIGLSKDEFRSYEDERRAGRQPKVVFNGKTIVLSARRAN